MQDFDVLSEFGKYCKSETFKQKLSEFFWRIIADSDNYNEELLKNCITKFADMVKYWTLEQKQPFFDRLPEQVNNTQSSVLPLL